MNIPESNTERNIDHKIGNSVIWTERVAPTEHGDIFLVALYRKVHGVYNGEYPTYMSTNLHKRSRPELAKILNNLRNDYG